MRTAYGKWNAIALGSAAALALVAWALLSLLPTDLSFSDAVGMVAVAGAAIAAALATLVLACFLLRFGIVHGWRYFRSCVRITVPLRRALLDAGYSIKRCGLVGEYEELPRIRIEIARDGLSVKVRVENSIRFDKRLEDVDLSSAINGYVLERAYLADDRSERVFELVDASKDFSMVFETYGKFETYVREGYDRYHLFLDSRSAVGLCSALVVGQTGSGKSYLLYSLVLQLHVKEATLYLCDPKNSGLASLGRLLCPERTGVSLDEIIGLLERFVSEMEGRKAEMQELLSGKLDATAFDFGLAPAVFVIDEYAALAYALRSRDKRTRDHVAELISAVVLMGRQLGFVLVLAMQKSDATLIDTAMRENLPLVVVLGNAQQQTIVTAFGQGVNVPERDNKPGEGVFMEPHIAPTPKLMQAPDLRFLSDGIGFLGRGSCNDPRPHKAKQQH
jgi:hypothetical protein